MADMLSMDELLVAPAPPAVPGAPRPQNAPVHGSVYGFTCPTHGSDMVAMTKPTFLEFGTHMEALRRSAIELDKKVKELHAQYAELQTKHENLRHATRKDRLARLEDKIVLPKR